MNSHATDPTPQRAPVEQKEIKTDGQGAGPEELHTSRIQRRIDQPQQLAPPHQLPAFRDLQMLINAIQDEEVDFAQFCVVLGDVPHVKKLILRDAQSILAGRTNRIENLKHAVAMLGLRKIRLMLAQLAEPYERQSSVEQEVNREQVARVSA